MDAEYLTVLECDPRVMFAADGSWVDDKHGGAS